MDEVKMMCELKHKNLLGAIAYGSTPPLVITELAERGSLRTILMDGNSGYNLHRGVGILSDVSQGMLFLHTRNPPLIHRDLKSGNILVTNDWEGKVRNVIADKAFLGKLYACFISANGRVVLILNIGHWASYVTPPRLSL